MQHVSDHPHSTQFDGRYAPSPTGDLHLGNLRTAVAAWLFARTHGARLVLRIDDLDPDRFRPDSAERQIADLQALGLDWDGEPVVQSHRLDRYHAALAQLVADGLAYPCFCTRADIRAAASAPHGDSPELAYPGTCSHLDVAATNARIAAGAPHCLRVRARGARDSVDDLLVGNVAFTVDDFVVRRKDGVPAYLLATTVDDHDLEIGTVVRGADLLPSAPRQIWLAQTLGISAPSFAHIGLVRSGPGHRLAKRDGAVTLRELAARGTSAAQVLTWIGASLGLCDPDEMVDAELLLGRSDTWTIPHDDVQFEPL